MFHRDTSTPQKVRLDIAVDRLRDLVNNSLILIDELLGHPEYNGSKEKLLGDLDTVLNARNVIVSKLSLGLNNSQMNDLVLVLDMRRKTISAQSSRFPTKRIMLNAALRVAG